MAALVLASSLFSAIATFYNRRSIEDVLLSWANNPALQAYVGSWATETISALIRKGQTASHQVKEGSPTWTQAILLTLCGLIVGMWIGWYLRGPQTPTTAAPLQPQPQHIVLQNVVQIDRRMRARRRALRPFRLTTSRNSN
ncbi:uncharacterized protein LOC142557412 isoform X2 [Dermacentor variabilis]|uniref:uncharacterized protein LOC142557412 isoform X2 n=1 Tax=Dermacentor variabilis TaxID=34621 RepID=UPI003F5C2514